MHIKTSELASFELGFGGYTCNWGVHMCGLYETEEERDSIIFGLLSQGFKNNDLNFYCPSERNSNDFISEYSSAHPDYSSCLSNQDSIVISSPKDLYYPQGTFSPLDMDERLDSFYTHSQSKGPRNVRATAEMVWALEAIPGREHLMVYESRLNYFISRKPWISICLYNITRFTGDIIMQVLRTHPYTISKGVITENPFYQDPDDWLAEYAPEFLKK